MERITLFIRSTKTDGEIKLRFRVIDGRDVQLYHKSEIKASLEDLQKFDIDGTVKRRVSVYNESLAEAIKKEIDAIKKAYRQMKVKGITMTSQNLEDLIEIKRAPEEKKVFVDNSLLKRFSDYVEAGFRDGVFSLSRYKHDKGTIGKLSRFLSIKHKKTCTVQDFNEVMLMEFREFVQNEFEYVPRFPKIYEKIHKRDTPTERRSNNTVANEMQVLRAFFTELEDTEEINRSPFRKISRDRRVILTKKKYDDPFFLRKEEFETLRDFKPAKTLEETKEAFLLHCALGCRIGDFQRFTMDNVGVSEEGIPYIHYLPEKTKGTQKDNSETITPLVRYTFDIIKRTQLNLPILKYPSGKSGYNKKIKQLLKAAGIDRKVTEFDEVEGVNKYIPICETSSSKLARSTHVDMMNKVQINIYAAGLHRQSSGAVTHYTMLELADRFKLMNLAFDQEDYRVDKNLEVIPK